MKFPLIVKPNAEGSLQGHRRAPASSTTRKSCAPRSRCCVEKLPPAGAGRGVHHGPRVHRRPARRQAAARAAADGDQVQERRRSSARSTTTAVKQEWEKHVYYECPAKLTEAEQKAMEKIARATFWALDCRDVARVDLRMDADGRIYVLEVNPLPGLTPDYSDLVLIAKAVGMDVRPADRRDHGRRPAPAARQAARGARANEKREKLERAAAEKVAATRTRPRRGSATVTATASRPTARSGRSATATARSRWSSREGQMADSGPVPARTTMRAGQRATAH